jgi:hypothetical protein
MKMCEWLLFNTNSAIFQLIVYPVLIVLWLSGARMAQWVRSLDLTAHRSQSPMQPGFAPDFVNYKKGALDSRPRETCKPLKPGMNSGAPEGSAVPPPLVQFDNMSC